MCVPACTNKIYGQSANRRGFLKFAAGAAVAATATGCRPVGSVAHEIMEKHHKGEGGEHRKKENEMGGIIDLTHTISPEFPTFSGDPGIEFEPMALLAENGYNMNRWLLVEHTGTHLDAPFHFSDQDSADQIPIENLIGPLANIDIRAKAAENPDAQLTPDDLAAWEEVHGPIPAGAIVAMNSGWDQHIATEMFRNADDEGAMHFPGFHIEAIEFLLAERDVKGIMVDTLSLDYGLSADFAVHYSWLPTNRWGVENAANLGALPESGAKVFVGSPKIAGATGGPSRIVAFV